jgi:hypothetical protein
MSSTRKAGTVNETVIGYEPGLVER